MTEPRLPRFGVGGRVCLHSDPSSHGRVDACYEYGDGWTYDVFFGQQGVVSVNERDLVPAPVARLQVLTRDEFLRDLLLAKLDNPLTDLFYAYQASRTQSEAYQFKPVLKFLDAPVPRLLIADEVGLGKTIEAAILYQELKARERVNRVLIVCPAGLRDKWQMELATRFDEQFLLLRRPDILRDIDLFERTNGNQPLRGIIGLEAIRGRRVLDALEQRQPSYDLVIIDEAHHLRTAGRLSNEAGEILSELADRLVLLTATPLQTSQQDLFNLLRFLDDTQFTDFGEFVAQLAPNRNLNAAIRGLKRHPPDFQAAFEQLRGIAQMPASEQVTSHPNYAVTLRDLAASSAGSFDRERVARMQRDIDRMNVISSVYTRTKKVNVANVARRNAHTIKVEITEQERRLYAAVLAHARAQARAASGPGRAPGWAGMMRERQVASCMAAMRDYLLESPSLDLGRLRVEESSNETAPEVPRAVGRDGPVSAAAAEMLAAARDLGTGDSKLNAFLTALREAISGSAAHKVIVFSFFRRTLAHLETALRGAGYETILIHGDVKPESRTLLIDQFKNSPNLNVLLTSEVGAEGLDFQFCDTLMNYDLPWNPMRVEQRIGRIDRYGQRQPQIGIYSFFLRDTIEERILERLYERIGIFEDSIGDLEPILGPVTADLTRELFSNELTPDQEREIAERTADMVVQRRLEEEDLERRSAELLGQDALLMQEITHNVESGRYVSPGELRAVVGGFLAEATLGSELRDYVHDGTVTLVPDGKLFSLVQAQMDHDQDSRPVATEFLGKLTSRAIPATFDGEIAHGNPRLEFLNLRHPLVRAAVEHFREKPIAGVRAIDVEAVSEDFRPDLGPWPPQGRYLFGLYLLLVRGAKRESRLVPVVFDESGRRVPAAEDRLLRLLQDYARDVPNPAWTDHDLAALQARSRAAVAAEADQVEATARDRNDALVAVRKATIQRTLRSKIAKRQEYLLRATDDRIIRMRRREIENLRAELARRLEELEQQRDVSVTSAHIGFGRITIRPADRAVPAMVAVEAPKAADREIAGYEEPAAVFRR
jgi:superfamily II DNA or RNA helicase